MPTFTEEILKREKTYFIYSINVLRKFGPGSRFFRKEKGKMTALMLLAVVGGISVTAMLVNQVQSNKPAMWPDTTDYGLAHRVRVGGRRKYRHRPERHR